MSKILNLLEPTLFDQTGHGYSYVQSLITANKDFNFDINVWLDRRGANVLQSLSCTAHPYFYRSLRRLQKIWLYFKLLRRDEIIFIGTSELWDLKILAFYAGLFKPKAKVILHFHQFKQSPKKLATLQRLAAKAKDFVFLTPTEKLTALFHNNGYPQCSVMPCPSFYPARNVVNTDLKFSKVLYAGAARRDKGFPQVIQLLQHMRANSDTTNFEIQISTPNSQRYDAETQAALQLLENIPNNNLTLHRNTLDQSQYQALFSNSICLLLYDQQDYQDKFSGIALDAFYAGCPIITAKDTWMGDMVEKYNAGVALANYNNAMLQQAISVIRDNYELYAQNAKYAAEDLRKLHDPKNTLDCIAK